MDPELTVLLPTGGGAKIYSGLSTESFIKKPTVQKITQEGLEKYQQHASQ